MAGKVSKPNNPPTLADALAPGLDSKERAERVATYANYARLYLSYPNNEWKIKDLVTLLDAHARDARRAALNEAMVAICNANIDDARDQRSGRVDRERAFTLALSAISPLLKEPHDAQR